VTAEGNEQNIRGMLSSGGEPMENFIRTYNWSTTCLGSSEQWPQSLRLTLNLCLSSHSPMAIALGQSLTLIFNDAWKTLFGSPLTPEALGRSGREVWPHLWSVIGAQLENAFAQKQAITQENCRLLIDRQGHQEIYFTYSGVPLLEETGEVSGIFITATETTSSVQQQQRHQVIELPHSSGQEILRQSEERLRLASEVSRLGIWDWDLKRNVLTWNQQCKALFGLANNLPMSYKAFLSALHPDDRELFYTAFRSALRPPGRLEVEYRIIWSNGEVRWLSTFGLATFAGRESCGSDQCSSDQSDSVSSGELDLASTERAGEAIRFTGTFLDITEQKQTNLEYAQLLEREQQYTDRLKRLAEAAVAIHSALSLHERLQLITDQARSIIQAHQCVTSTIADETGAQAIYATSLSDHYQPWQKKDFQPDHTGLYRMICRTQRPIRLTQSELESHPDGDMISQSACYSPIQGWLAAPLTSQNGKNIGLIQLSDKSEGEFTEEDEAILVQLAQMAAAAIDNAHLYEASEQANQIKDDFLAILSHELRSPLNAILGWSKLLQAQQFDKTTTLRALETIERNAQLQTQLIEDLLDVSRILRNKICLQIAPVNPIEPMTAAIETMSLAAEAKAIEIIPRFDPDIGLVPGDSSRLQQIFWNLLSNAIKFTPQGGQVTVELKRSQTHVHIQVSDTGKGISAEFLPYIFDHFR
jgi:PAS domain S-box-containing protein